MRFLIKVLAVTAAVVSLSAAGLWYFVLGGDAAARAKIEQTATVQGTSLGGAYTLTPGDRRSFVGYRVQEQFVGAIIESTATGRTHNVTATLTIHGTTVEKAQVDADLSSLKSDKAGRDSSITSAGLESNSFPRAQFVLTQPIRLATPPKRGDTITTTATGEFTLHGVTKPTRITLQGRWDGNTIQVVASLPITFADYRIKAPNIGGFVSVKDHGEIELQLFLRPASPQESS